MGFGGSSPRARGTGPHRGVVHPELRFIPARAGNGNTRPASTASSPVHPRARGERVLEPTSAAPSIGSSPRARGTVRVMGCPPPPRRFIPARAGNGRRCRRSRRAAGVHPRARGERAPEASSNPAWIGSSPRARGTGGLSKPPSFRLRFIPARAGNGPITGARLSAANGSSPRARGTGIEPARRMARIRFIPARAGNG